MDNLDNALNKSIEENVKLHEKTSMVGGGTDIALDKKDITSVLRITKYELPVIIGARTLQIDKGSKIFIHNPDMYMDSRAIAMEEFKRDLIPFILKRPINKDNGIYENIKISDLYHPLKYK